MSIRLDEWKRIWSELGARTLNGGLMNQLVAAYSEPHRKYHTLAHLRDCLAHFDAARPLARRPAEVELALWFHDAVYDPRRADNEERSAAWAHASVLASGCAADIADRVRNLVLATQHHEASEACPGRREATGPGDPDTRLLVDVDLTILGTPYSRFDEYEGQVREEYAHVDDAAWREGRARVLRAFLDRPRIYQLDVFHDVYEKRARENLQRALDAFTA
ncbi:N-methyl-D-aspartate receptor NMDAR2C subunit [Ramlibacter algicola]|uniref:N-methyl-D-aspartate receptor NMDAR2C subunit n=1 Tax=Ramlibacter algicola TaxID=2795217 RepID=A0A934Q0Y2_9BURK|nr:N-methyl-D-aspartate receptor NMDAR2C subunit [Ramlibacter algicola]